MVDKSVEDVVLEIFENVLGSSSLSLSDDFFDRGGHSLLALRASARLEVELGVDVPIRLIFDYPVFRDLSDYLATLASGADVR